MPEKLMSGSLRHHNNGRDVDNPHRDSNHRGKGLPDIQIRGDGHRIRSLLHQNREAGDRPSGGHLRRNFERRGPSAHVQLIPGPGEHRSEEAISSSCDRRL